MKKLFVITLVVLAFSASADWYQSDLTILGAPGSIDPVLNSTEATFDFDSILVTTEIKSGTIEALNVNGITFTDDGGVVAIFIKDGGNVGIGTITPNTALEVSGSIPQVHATRAGSTNSGFGATNGDGSWYFGKASSSEFVISESMDLDLGTEFVICTDGKVGIGTASPAQMLEISGGATIVAQEIENTNDAYSTQLELNSGSQSSYIIQRGKDYATAALQSDMQIYNSFSTGEIKFHTASSTPDMTIAADGKVGIGTASPAQMLEISGGATIVALEIENTNDAYTTQLELNSGSQSSYIIQRGKDYATTALQSDMQIYNSFSTGEIKFHTGSATPDMTIAADGKVGIGTTSPGEMLEVNGTIECVHVTETSDARCKENIADVKGISTDKIKALRARSWDWKDSDKGSTIGFVAQELEQVIPEAVVTHPAMIDEETGKTIREEHKAIVPTVILTHLIKTVQELEARIKKLEE
ncbi:MAG: hypothetical protein DRP09_14205 [Candidatus Thorarchaeota archaeon]|nr:MAG: hypothetical protein DRP09_14205 [Candidatus Thorarchaeota archaeon]